MKLLNDKLQKLLKQEKMTNNLRALNVTQLENPRLLGK